MEMKPSTAVTWLAILVAVLALVATSVALFWQDGGSPFPFTTLRGETAQMYGQGLYRLDSLFTGAGYKGQDTVTLVLGIPLLAICIVLYRRGSVRGSWLLMGTLSYFLYVYASMALAAAYNVLFLVYVALFSASLFAFVLAFAGLDLAVVAAPFTARLPRRGIAIFMFACGVLTFIVWLEPLVTALIQGAPPKRLDASTTKVTDALDLGIIVPSTLLAGTLLLRRNLQGYRVAFPLLVLIVMLLPGIALSTVNQVAAGVVFTPGEIVGPISGFLVLGLIALAIIVVMLRAMPPARAAAPPALAPPGESAVSPGR
jgi:hypothetical protein